MNNAEQKPGETVVQANAQVAQPTTPPPQAQPVNKDKPTLAEANKNTQAEGFNLIPAMSEEEKVKIKTKNTLNISSILSIIALASIAIGIVGFNIISKAQLNSYKSSLFRIEKTITSKMDKIIANNAIVARARLYSKVKKDSFSHKKIIEFLNEIAFKIGGITFRGIEISEDLSFKLTGNAPNLEQISKLWYLFGVHENIKTINLDSVSKDETGARFTFEGEFNLKNFSNE